VSLWKKCRNFYEACVDELAAILALTHTLDYLLSPNII
jgi:hypothetical protein